MRRTRTHSAVYAMTRGVCLSVIRRCSIETAIHEWIELATLCSKELRVFPKIRVFPQSSGSFPKPNSEPVTEAPLGDCSDTLN